MRFELRKRENRYVSQLTYIGIGIKVILFRLLDKKILVYYIVANEKLAKANVTEKSFASINGVSNVP